MAYRASMRRRVIGGSIVALVILILVPAVVVAATNFEDVPPSNVFYNDIMWMAESGVTKGCSDTRFCPDDFVTREQMAAFMRRLATGGSVDAGSLGGLNASDYVTHSEIGPTSLDAETLDGLDSTAFLRKSATAADSEKLDGLDSTAFLRKSATAADSEKLDGLNSTAFLMKNRSPRATYDFVRDASEVDPLIMSITMTAPASGILLVEGTIDIRANGALDTVVCFLGAGGEALPGTSAFVTVDYLDLGEDDEGLCTTVAGYTVSGGTYVIDFVAGSVESTPTALLDSGNMVAQWFPFDGTGAVPAATTELNTYDGGEAKPYDLEYLVRRHLSD